jgi:hypothetical protein
LKNSGFRTLKTSRMSCICDKEVLFFGADSRDTRQLLYLLLTVHKHDLLGLKNWRFCLVKNDRKGKNGLKVRHACLMRAFHELFILLEKRKGSR